MNHNTFIPVDLMELQTSLQQLRSTPEQTTTTFTASQGAALPASRPTPGVEILEDEEASGGQGGYASMNPDSMQYESMYSKAITTPRIDGQEKRQTKAGASQGGEIEGARGDGQGDYTPLNFSSMQHESVYSEATTTPQIKGQEKMQPKAGASQGGEIEGARGDGHGDYIPLNFSSMQYESVYSEAISDTPHVLERRGSQN